MGVADNVIAVAKAEVGTRETFSGGHWVNDSKYNKWYGRIPGYPRSGYDWPWCAAFVSYVADTAGVASLYPRTASCAQGVEWFRAKGRFSEYPAIGAQVFFGPGGGSHTGIVYAYDADKIYTVEGNTNASGGAEGDGVYLKVRNRRDVYTYGYGYPLFPEGIVSADPAYGNAAPKPPVVTPPPPPPAPSYEPFPGAGWFGMGRRSPVVKAMRQRLIAEGCNRYQSSADQDVIGNGDVRSYEAWQRKCGFSGSAATWPPGKTTWDRLRVPNV